MNSEELKTFIFLSKIKNFTLAAEKLQVAQSTVTNRISELEKELGKRLFARSAKSIKLTDEGEIFLRYAERIIELEDSSIEEMNAALAHRRKFCIGAINATYEMYVKPLVDQCLVGGETSVKIVLSHSLDLIRQLQDNVLELVFTAVPLNRVGFHCDVYATDRLALVCAKGKNEYPNGIKKEQLERLPYLMCDLTLSTAGNFIRSLFPSNHIFKLEVDNSSKLLPYLKDGLGYTFLPYKMIEEDLNNGVLEEVKLKDFEAPQMTTYILYRRNYDVTRFLENKF